MSYYKLCIPLAMHHPLENSSYNKWGMLFFHTYFGDIDDTRLCLFSNQWKPHIFQMNSVTDNVILENWLLPPLPYHTCAFKVTWLEMTKDQACLTSWVFWWLCLNSWCLCFDFFYFPIFLMSKLWSVPISRCLHSRALFQLPCRLSLSCGTHVSSFHSGNTS